jgi:adenylate cyclase class IV
VALRNKEREVAELKTGLAASKLREAEIQADTYYREICRWLSITEQLQVVV